MWKKNTNTSFYANFANVGQLGMLLKFQLTDILGITHHHAISVPHVANNSYEKYNLEAHINTNDSEKFFNCVYPKCTWRYKCKAEYNWHVKTYTGPQFPFSWPVCNKAFDFKKYLNEHLKIHSDNLPQKCPYCDKWYKWRSSVDAQVKLKHLEFAKR